MDKWNNRKAEEYLKDEKSHIKAIDERENTHRNNMLVWNVKNFIFSGVILTLLIWGSSFLLSAISRFQETLVLKESFRNSNLHRNTYTPEDFGGKIPLNFSAVRDGVFSPKYEQLQWIQTPESIQDDKGTYILKEESDDDDTRYVIRSIVDEEYEYSLFNSSIFTFRGIDYTIDKLTASPDLKKAILKTNSTHNWRHSTFGIYWILDVSGNTIRPLHNEHEKLAVVSWSPNSRHIAFILSNNVYLFDTESQQTTQVTFDGDAEVFYGKPDWVYEEEVFSSDITLWWSPSGNKITFLKLNDTEVPEFTIPYYVQDGYEDYPEMRKLKYPKAGYANPIVDLLTYEINGGNLNYFSLESENIKKDNQLITEVVWVGESVLVKTSNRASDLLEIFLIDTVTSQSKIVRSHSAVNSWFEITSNTLYIPKNETAGLNTDGYIDTVVVDGYNHLAYFSPPESSDYKLLTSGKWEVVDGVESFDYVHNDVYFISTEKSSIERHINVVNLAESIKSIPLVKEITTGEGWYSGSFSSGSRYILLTYEGPDVPYQKIIDLQTLEDIKLIQANEKLSEALETYVLPKVNFQVVDLIDKETGNIIKANAMETLPLNFNPKNKYPVLFFVYGGPGSQLVQKRFAVSFSAVVAAELNCVVVTVDGRGTGYNNHNSNGSKFKFTVRDKLGHYEPLDQIAAAKYWSEKSYVDSDNIAIWGWSYGGFMTLKTLETDLDNIFSYGVAIAPVTQWKFYDSIYTERYMRTPQENTDGYKIASIHDVSNFKNVKKFFIGHGSGDDNVHIQNTLKLIDDFDQENVENFDFMIFPDSDHSIRYHNGNKIVYDRILAFFRRAFNGNFI